MNTTSLRLLSILFFPTLLFANRGTLQMRGGYFYPTSELMRDIYHDGGGEFEIQASLNLNPKISLWGNFNFFQRNGDLLGLCDNTRIQIYPLSIGALYIKPIHQRISLYFGMGASYSLLKIDNESPLTMQNIRNIPQNFRENKNGWGLVTKTGITLELTDHLFLDVFADYYYTKMDILLISRQVSGLRTGIGLGIYY